MSYRSKFMKRSLNMIFNQKFDLIVSNPPYIRTRDLNHLSDDITNYEPRSALDGGNDGLDVIKKVIYKSRSILKKKGMLALEIGNRQHKKVLEILRLNSFRKKFLVKDGALVFSVRSKGRRSFSKTCAMDRAAHIWVSTPVSFFTFNRHSFSSDDSLSFNSFAA